MIVIPLLVGAGVALVGMIGAGSYTAGAATGAATSDKLGTGISLASVAVGLFLIFYLAYRFNLFKR